MPRETTPLLPSDKLHHDRLTSSYSRTALLTTSTSPPSSSSSASASRLATLKSTLHGARLQTHRFLTCKIGHYAVLTLVSLDVACIFADFLISLYACERFACGRDGDEGGTEQCGFEKAQEALGIVSVVFSCVFLVELGASFWAFGVRQFLSSKFHIFDAVVIIASFILDVCLKGVLEEVTSVVIVLRLWRVFKIIEELGAQAQEDIDKVEERVRELEKENEGLRRRLESFREGHGAREGSAGNGDGNREEEEFYVRGWSHQ